MEIPLQSQVTSPIMIGRTTEITLLSRLVDLAKSGKGQVALLSGEAGIGKSRLVAEVKAYASSHSFSLFEGSCFPTDVSSPFAPLLDLVRSSAATEFAAAVASDLAPFARELHHLLPDLVSISPHQFEQPLPSPEHERQRLFVAFTHFLVSQARRQPLLVVIEDLHWSDESSLELLHYLVRRCSEHPLLLVFTYRGDEVGPGLRHFLSQLDRERLAEDVPLMGLSKGTVEEMLRAIFALTPRAHWELPSSILELTEGNPFFVEEVLKSLITAGDIFYKDGNWEHKPLSDVRIPRSARDAVELRTARLSADARHILIFAAVAGKRFDFALLQQVTHETEERLLLFIKELISAQLVVEESADRFAFRHALTREAIYAELLGRERKALHHTIAGTMEQLYAGEIDVHLADLVYHFYAAGAWEKVFEFGRRSGEKALALYAHRIAVESFTYALTAAYHLSLIPPPGLFLARGQAYEAYGEFDRARADFEAALEGARQAEIVRLEWEALLCLGMLWAGRDYERSGEYYQHAFQLARGLHDPSLTARSLNRVGNWHLNVEHPEEALAHHQQALEIFSQLEDQWGTAETLDLLGMASYLSGDLQRGTGYYQQAVPLLRRLDDRRGLASSLATLTMRGITYQTDTMSPTLEPASAVIADGELALQIARDTDQRAAEAYALIFLAFALGPHGDYAQALEYAHQGLHLASEVEHRQWMTAAHCALGALYRDLFALAPAIHHFEEALHLAREIYSLHWIRTATGHLASTYVLANSFLSAESILEATLTSTTPARTLGQRLVWCARAELSLARKEPSEALHAIDLLMSSAARPHHSPMILRLAPLRGEALTSLKQTDEAEPILEQATTTARYYGALPLLWRIQLVTAKCYQAQRRYEAAEESFLAAQSIVEQLASRLPDDALRAGFREHATHLLTPVTSSSRRAAKRAYGGLTTREREIAARVAGGQSSREIAAALVISERTVETHVGNILSKLGYHARTQIATWAAKQGLVWQDH